MKPIKKILIVFNLVLFISSLFVTSFNGFLKSNDPSDVNHLSTQVSAKTSDDNSSLQLIGEKIENESENDYHIQTLLLPFLVSFFQFETFRCLCPFAKPLAEVQTNPIYLAICNFRI